MSRSPKKVLARGLVTTVARAAPLALAVSLGVACSGTGNSVGYAPVTGIIIRSDGLLRELGCGTRDGQVASYAAILRSEKGADPTLGGAPAPIYPCFADATFSNLTPVAGSVDFAIEVYAFNDAAARTVGASIKKDAAADCACCVAGTCIGPETLKGVKPSAAGEKMWRARCVAKLQEDVVVLAVCSPLARAE